MILEIHGAVKNFFALRMRARDEVVGVEKPKTLTLNMLPCFAKSTRTKRFATHVTVGSRQDRTGIACLNRL